MKVDIRGKSFGETRVLGPIRFEVGAAEAVSLVGPSGIGKSTLLRIIAGLDETFEGSVEGVGRVSFVFQEPTLLPWRSAKDNIEIATGVTSARAYELLTSAGLDDKSEMYPAQLSLGQRRRIAIVRAFAREPETLLMDEPFASLDAQSIIEMQNLLLDLLRCRPTRVILVTHDEVQATTLTDRTIRLEGVPAQVSDQSAVRN
ncbi:UNVERIFIED_CONTAM: hypothetical protein GTU68_065834 [Idotea baltica]|nr:hypothetical protein [Idotea baltica]